MMLKRMVVCLLLAGALVATSGCSGQLSDREKTTGIGVGGGALLGLVFSGGNPIGAAVGAAIGGASGLVYHEHEAWKGRK